MDGNNSLEEQEKTQGAAAPQPQQPPQPQAKNNNQITTPGLQTLHRVTATILMVSGITFGIIAVLSIWGVFEEAGDIVWQSLGTLAVIALVALVINVGSRIYEGKS